VKAKVIDDNGAPIVGDKLFDLVGGDNSIENLIKRLESCQLREVLVTVSNCNYKLVVFHAKDVLQIVPCKYF